MRSTIETVMNGSARRRTRQPSSARARVEKIVYNLNVVSHDCNFERCVARRAAAA